MIFYLEFVFEFYLGLLDSGLNSLVLNLTGTCLSSDIDDEI
jgi:hypothetical protein